MSPGACCGLVGRGELQGGRGTPPLPTHSDHFRPASHPAQGLSLTWSLTHPSFPPVLTHVPAHYYSFSPCHPWETPRLSPTLTPSLKTFLTVLFPRSPSHHCLQKQFQSHCCEVLSQKFINSQTVEYFSPAKKVRVSCMGKYPWTTATELQLLLVFLQFVEGKSKFFVICDKISKNLQSKLGNCLLSHFLMTAS